MPLLVAGFLYFYYLLPLSIYNIKINQKKKKKKTEQKKKKTFHTPFSTLYFQSHLYKQKPRKKITFPPYIYYTSFLFNKKNTKLQNIFKKSFFLNS
jgi:hypothetical protein